MSVKDLKLAINADVRSILAGTAMTIESKAKLLIQNSPRGGRQYGSHKASAPGEPPAIDTGFLINSIQTSNLPHGSKVFVGAEYGEGLEYGTRKIMPRPFFEPSVKAGADYLKRNMAKLNK